MTSPGDAALQEGAERATGLTEDSPRYMVPDTVGTVISSRGVLILRELRLFAGLPEEMLDRLVRDSEEVVYPRGEAIFSEDQPCRHLHVVLSGEVKIYKVSDGGREQVIHVMRPGSFFGEDVLFGGERYEAGAQALSSATLLNIKKDALEAVALQYPPFALAMLADFGRRLKRLMMLIGEIALQDVRTRLCRVLLDLVEQQHQGPAEPAVIRIRHVELATLVGTARETLSRALGRLEQDGLIERRERAIVLRDRSGLLRQVPHWREEVQLFPIDHGRFRQA